MYSKDISAPLSQVGSMKIYRGIPKKVCNVFALPLHNQLIGLDGLLNVIVFKLV